MSGDTQSRQERAMKVFCGRLMSAPFLFCPEEWKIRSSKVREPADIVWACNNCVVLMYLTGSKRYEREQDNTDEYLKDLRHNLRQATTAMRLWQDRAISGKNEWQRFWLPLKKDTRVVVLSVVQVGTWDFSERAEHAFVEIHADWALRHGAKLCATLPQTVLQQLAGVNGSVLDLFLLLNGLRESGQTTISEIRFLEMANGYRNLCLRSSESLRPEDSGHPGFDERSAGVFAMAGLTLAKTRHRPTPKRGGDLPTAIGENIGARSGILSDMDLEEFFTIARALTICVERAGRSDELQIIDLALRQYDCCVCVARRAGSEADCKETYEAWAKPRKAGLERPGLFIFHIREKGQVYCWPVPRIGPSYTEQVLDTFGKPGSGLP